jgi:hypothetical protein
MIRALVALLIAVCTAASLMASAVHGGIFVLVIACAAVTAGLAAYAEPFKKNAGDVYIRNVQNGQYVPKP